MNRRTTLTALALIAALGAGTGADGRAADAAGTSTATVSVKLVEFKLIASPKRVPAGTVTFVVRNAGRLTHELVVLKTTTPAGKLATKGMEAVETGKVGQLAALPPRKTTNLSLKLRAGHYALICNIPGHYTAGQFADLTVR